MLLRLAPCARTWAFKKVFSVEAERALTCSAEKSEICRSGDPTRAFFVAGDCGDLRILPCGHFS
jgi:hypothetical protein